MLSPPVPFFFVKSAEGKGNSSEWTGLEWQLTLLWPLEMRQTVRLLAITMAALLLTVDAVRRPRKGNHRVAIRTESKEVDCKMGILAGRRQRCKGTAIYTAWYSEDERRAGPAKYLNIKEGKNVPPP
jgi:hypothetical protein